MKKFLKIAIALLGLLVLSAAFTSCDKENGGGSSKVYYIASGQIKISGSGFSLTGPSVADYQNAIDKAVGSGAVTPNDAAAISACEAVYATHKQPLISP